MTSGSYWGCRAGAPPRSGTRRLVVSVSPRAVVELAREAIALEGHLGQLGSRVAQVTLELGDLALGLGGERPHVLGRVDLLLEGGELGLRGGEALLELRRRVLGGVSARLGGVSARLGVIAGGRGLRARLGLGEELACLRDLADRDRRARLGLAELRVVRGGARLGLPQPRVGVVQPRVGVVQPRVGVVQPGIELVEPRVGLGRVRLGGGHPLGDHLVRPLEHLGRALLRGGGLALEPGELRQRLVELALERPGPADREVGGLGPRAQVLDRALRLARPRERILELVLLGVGDPGAHLAGAHEIGDLLPGLVERLLGGGARRGRLAQLGVELGDPRGELLHVEVARGLGRDQRVELALEGAGQLAGLSERRLRSRSR